MPKKHKKWKAILVYCKELPISEDLIAYIRQLISQNMNVLIMIKKEDHETNPHYTQNDKFQAFCDVFPNERIMGKIIISAVPDITEIENSIF